MYKQRKNFSTLDIPSADKKRLEAKQIFSSIMEALSVEQVNALYQQKQVPEENKYTPATTAPNTPELKFDTLQAPATTDAELKKTYDDTLVLGITKPYKVVFTDLAPSNPSALKEDIEVEMLDDEVLVPMEADKTKTKKEDDKAEEDSETAHEEHEENETKEEEEKEHEDGEEDETGNEDYNFLDSLPQLDLSSDMIDAVNKAGQGIVMINPNVTINVDSGKIPEMHKGEKIKSVEDDLDGLSVVGLDNDLGMKLFQ